MRSQLLTTLLLVLALPLFANDEPPRHTGEIVVGYHDAETRSAATGRHAVHGARLVKRLPAAAAELVRPEPEAGFEAVLQRYRDDPAVRFADPNYIVETQAPLPTATYIDHQWWICEEQAPGMCLEPGTDTGAAFAWEAWRGLTGSQTPGSADVTVAVIDTGVRAQHPDLAPNVLTEHGCEIRGTTIQDFDPAAPCPPDRQDFSDSNGHGTHIAGIIGAVSDRSDAAVAGLNWRVGLLPLKALEDVGSGTVVDTSNAILYAMERGGPLIINASYGYRASEPHGYELDVLREADKRNVLVIAAAGNDGRNNDAENRRFFPASHRLRNVIGVAASVRDGGRAGYSRFGGNTVLLAAPGGESDNDPTAASMDAIWSTYVTEDGDTGELVDAVAGLSGTSMAAPMVAGAAALRLSLEPDLRPRDLREILVSTAVADPAWTGLVLAGGRLDAAATVTADLQGLPPMPASHLEARERSNATVELQWLDNSSINSGYVVERRLGEGAWEDISGTLPADSESFVDAQAQLPGSGFLGYRVVALGGADADCCISAVVVVNEVATGGSGVSGIAGSGGSSNPCFIATAAYGTPLSAEVQSLRDFREQHLRGTAVGRWFIRSYERHSPPIAGYIAERPRLRAAVRVALRPWIWLARRLTQEASGN